jgi:hypothetical protein
VLVRAAASSMMASYPEDEPIRDHLSMGFGI